MATVRTECRSPMSPDAVWAAFADFGAVHTRLAPGFVTDTKIDAPGSRVVTFANGMTARELLVTMDAGARRLVYAIVGSERLTHHNGAFQVHPDGSGSRITWTADMLPDAAAEAIGPMMEAGTAAMAKNFGA